MPSATPLTVAQVATHLEQLCPLAGAESWDNVGLLWGDRTAPARRAMTCLTLTGNVADEARQRGADLIVTHHPLPFRPLSRVTTDTREGAILWQLARSGISVYSPHTAFDSALEGINQQLAQALRLTGSQPLVPPATPTPGGLGAGRIGTPSTPTTLADLTSQVQQLLSLDHARVVGNDDQQVSRVAVACGSGGSLLEGAIAAGADVLVTGEATFHTLLSAQAAGMGVVLTGHYASERFALEWLADHLAREFPQLEAWASQQEHDPLRWVVR